MHVFQYILAAVADTLISGATASLTNNCFPPACAGAGAMSRSASGTKMNYPLDKTELQRNCLKQIKIGTLTLKLFNLLIQTQQCIDLLSTSD